MFEREIYQSHSLDQNGIDDLLSLFCDQKDSFILKSHMNWAEHCTECVMPDCFTSCSFYTPRPDMKCNRFEGGIKVLRDTQRQSILDITFKNWGKLEAAGASKMMTRFSGALYETTDILAAKAVKKLPLSFETGRLLRKKIYGAKNKLGANTGPEHVYAADAFFVEIANPGEKDISLTVTFRNCDNPAAFFQRQFILSSGYHRFQISVSDITRQVDLNQPYLCSFEPVGNDETARLIFGVLDFVRLNPDANMNNSKSSEFSTAPQSTEKKAKCVIWDLDNTLWQGILVEDGIDGLVVNQPAIDFIHALDKKGILNSVASKNNKEDALKVLEKLGLEDMFLYPQISWDPKSQSIANIQQALNIGMDTLVFIDDQIFEREEVKTRHPEIRAFDIADFEAWKNAPLFDVPVSTESAKRRQMYADQIIRETHFEQQDNNDYQDFLTQCQITVEMEPLSETTSRRAFELAQRTNQMNFSGTRYSMDEIQDLTASDIMEAHIIRCKDRFGDYGIVGLAVFNAPEKRLEDLMFSCRIQSKYVDHAVLVDFVDRVGDELSISYKATQKNRKSAQIFEELGFSVTQETNGVQILTRSEDAAPLLNDIVELQHVSE